MVYCLRSDSTGIIILPVVYIAMLAGNVSFILFTVYPSLTKYTDKEDGVDIAKKFPIGVLIEWFFYEFFSFLMIWSHSAV